MSVQTRLWASDGLPVFAAKNLGGAWSFHCPKCGKNGRTGFQGMQQNCACSCWPRGFYLFSQKRLERMAANGRSSIRLNVNTRITIRGLNNPEPDCREEQAPNEENDPYGILEGRQK